MKITAIAVTSLNSKLTRGEEGPAHWGSKEDQEFFSEMRKASKLIVMGSATFDAEKINPDTERLRVVLTKNPEKYKDLVAAGSLEFSNKKPKELVKDLERRGFDEMLLVGGAKVFSSFMEEGLINEFYLTVEPLVFGKGKPLFAEGDFYKKLKLVSVTTLNSLGTTLFKYSVD